jgi:spore maturation protein CgeB
VCLNLHRGLLGMDLASDEQVKPEETWSLGPRAYEIAACGGFQIAQAGRGELEEVFGDTVPVFETGEEMEAFARFAVHHDDLRAQTAHLQRRAARPCTFERRAKDIVLPILEAGLRR